MPTIIKLLFPGEIENPLLRYRAQRGHANRSHEFIAMEHGTEIGLLSYEDWSDQALGFVYEIFVLSQFRRHGVGTLLLSHAEMYAMQQHCNILRLKPHALDEEPNQSRLEAWYTKMGYLRDPQQAELMQKELNTPTPSFQLTAFCGG